MGGLYLEQKESHAGAFNRMCGFVCAGNLLYMCVYKPESLNSNENEATR